METQLAVPGDGHRLPQEYMTVVTWVLEPDIFPETHDPIRNAIRDRGHRLVDWSDAWWSDGVPPRVPKTSVVFHGSLGSEIVYVLDVCQCNGELRLLELNPFGGADLYACDAYAIIDSVSAVAAAA